MINITPDFPPILKNDCYRTIFLEKKDWTKRYRPWKVILTEEFETKIEAMQREKWLKTGVGRDFIKKLPH